MLNSVKNYGAVFPEASDSSMDTSPADAAPDADDDGGFQDTIKFLNNQNNNDCCVIRD